MDNRFFRFDRLGEDYSLDEIRDRILENIQRGVPFPEAEQEKLRCYREKYPPHPKANGLAVLYYYYCYQLHIIVKFPASVKRVSSYMREDIRKLEQLDEQTRLLGENHIKTAGVNGQLKDLRHSLKVADRIEKRAGHLEEMKEQLTG